MGDLYVLGPISECDEISEDGGPLWQAEVQTMGGYGVAATIYAGTDDAARRMAEEAIAAWNTRKASQDTQSHEWALLYFTNPLACPKCRATSRRSAPFSEGV